ncbi:hypothetical protein N7457_000918 [Penicillium paradoxum]|uniref:uncharacterized protein n=1 Tax=Penicillium paradoxum TaxID=176176 RepID=UPI002548F1ED|nr:uncharacterized protein N7457_000918 [Penicillium paradoxum]KAJ5794319.1 hypothetical protein N7457_000918 [Penicillium paradoxum]
MKGKLSSLLAMANHDENYRNPPEQPDATKKKQKKSELIDKLGRMLNRDVREEMPASEDIEIHTWHGPDDPENPFNSVLTGLPAGTYGSANDWIEKEFNVPKSPFPNLYWVTTSWNMRPAFWPLIFVPLTGPQIRERSTFMREAMWEDEIDTSKNEGLGPDSDNTV